jgi:hypothetical protein
MTLEAEPTTGFWSDDRDMPDVQAPPAMLRGMSVAHLKAALAWYADEANYRPRRLETVEFAVTISAIEADRGARARAALDR